LAPRLRPWAKKVHEYFAQLSAKIQETLQGINTVHACGLEENEKNLFTTQLSSYVKTRWQLFCRSLIVGTIIPSLLYFPLYGVLIWIGANEVMHNRLSIGGFMSFFTLFMIATAPVRGLSYLVSTFQPTMASIERLYEFYQYKPPQVRKTYQSLPAEIESISFEGVSFSYHNQKPILENIHLKIMRSKTIALVGDSGSGKTTIVNLLLGFLKPYAGVIRINNNIDLDEVKLEEWLKIIGLIEQDTFIFNRSIYENIKIARLDASKEEIEEAAKKAGLYEFIMSLPQGFQTMVGERGFAISGGERQRIAIARLFLKSPPIIIMDEPTSALDMDTEEKIMKELKILSEGRAVLITTHRHSLLKIADFIYEIKDGEIFDFKEISGTKGV
jgi:subfamily B ATP-binding cassette protein MsbA